MSAEVVIVMNRKFVTFFLFILSINGYAQQIIYGNVRGKEDNQPLPYVNVIDKISGKWTITKEDGSFSIQLQNDFELIFSLLGKENVIINYREYKPGTTIYLTEKTLKLDDVVVTATQESNKSVSSVVLDKYAISQFQSFSISDILQQLPGQSVKAPNLSKAQVIQNVRTAIESKNNGFGLTYILDDMPLSNDENMQTYNRDNVITSNSSINSGIDLRSIPSSNIEKVEVITGVADAKYGNATTGLVVIERQAGISPLRATAQIQKGGQSVSVDKGFQLPSNLGKLSLSLDYLDSKENPTNNLKGYERIVLSGTYTFEKENLFKNSFSATLRTNLDNDKEDLELANGFRDNNSRKDYGIVINNRSHWQFTDLWINRLQLQGGISYSYTNEIKEWFVNNGGAVAPTATTTALYSGVYTPPTYIGRMQTIGKPFNANIQISVEKNIQWEQWSHLIAAGITYNHSDNFGEGKVYDTQNAHTQSVLSSNISSREGVRGLNFNQYVFASKQLSVYVQDNIAYRFKNEQQARINIGFRYENQNGFSSVSPRINANYEFNNNFKLRGGIGLATKAPSLVNMFPGNTHLDILLKDIRTNHYSFNLTQTFVEPRPKVDLKPSKSWKYELGADIKTSLGKISLTAFRNYTYDGFDNETIIKLYPLPKIEIINNPDPAKIPSYSVSGYENYVTTYQQASNGKKIKDMGIEFFFNSQKIKSINTNFSLSGSYVHTNAINEAPVIFKNSDVLDKEHLFGVFTFSDDKVSRMSMRLTATHHIPHLALLISLTAEQFTFSNVFEKNSDNLPIGYVNPEGKIIYIAKENRNNPEYRNLKSNRTTQASKNKYTPTYHNFHLRITKEMANGLSVSLYVINFLDYKPKIYVDDRASFPNAPISFGVNIKQQF